MFPRSNTNEQERRSDLTSLRLLVGPHLLALEEFLQKQVENFEPEIRDLIRYCLEVGGKRIRASLVFLGGWREAGEVREDLVRLAAVVEMVHLATLIHDDIIDSAETRHNRESAARRFGPETAVLLGDALFAQAVNLSTSFPDLEICRQVSLATRRVVTGEISQTLRNRNGEFGREDYYRIVDLKTAELFSVSCRLGAHVAGFSEPYVAAVAEFGRHLGVAYQVYDDLVDFFGKEESVGKTLGTDLQSGKRTLPIIMLMERLDESQRAFFADELRSGLEDKLVARAAEMVERGVYREAVDEVVSEIDAARRAFEPFDKEAPTRYLLQIADRLGAQLEDLRAERDDKPKKPDEADG